MALIDDIKGMANSVGAELKEKKNVYTLRLVVAERKAFLSKKKLEYVARFSVDDAAKVAVHGDVEGDGLRGLRWRG